MLLNRTLITIKKKVVDIPLIVKYIMEGRYIDDAFRMYNDAIRHGTFRRLKITLSEFKDIWEYLK